MNDKQFFLSQKCDKQLIAAAKKVCSPWSWEDILYDARFHMVPEEWSDDYKQRVLALYAEVGQEPDFAA